MPLSPPSEAYDPRDMSILIEEIDRRFIQVEASVDDVRVRPRVIDTLISFDEAGRAYLTVRCNVDTLSFRYAISSDASPDAATVRANDIVVGNYAELTVEGPFATGSILYLSVLPYAGPNGDGREGIITRNSATRGVYFYAECRAVYLAYTETTVTVRVTGASEGGRVAVRRDSLTGATQVSGLAEGVDGDSPQTWVFARPAAGDADGEARFSATFPDAPDDADVILIPAQNAGPFVPLASRARIIAETAEQMVVRYAVADPFPQAADQIEVTIDPDGLTVSPTGPVTLTPVQVFSGQEGTYVDVTITKPEPGAGAAEVRFTAESLGSFRIADSDLVAVPERAEVPAFLDIDVETFDEEVEISWNGRETVTLKIDNGTFHTPPASPITVPRGPIGGQAKLYLFKADGANNSVATVPVTVPPQYAPGEFDPVISSVQITDLFAPGGGGFDGSFEVDWVEANMPGGQTYDITFSIFDTSGPGSVPVNNQLEAGVSKPATIAHPLGGDVFGRVEVRVYNGSTLIAEGSFEGEFIPPL